MLSTTMISTSRSTSPPSSGPIQRAKLFAKKASSLVPTNSKSRVKKGSLPLLDTNLNSYDRTDPFFAFNTLIKLLGSLPSRIGGCQYKLTPDEHMLSLHLLTIVEPFVGLAPSRRTITRQPTEVLDAIIFHVDSRKDLLALAMSCHRMQDIVCPRHLAYRVIRCKVSAISVWNHLIINRALARNVRRLEILDERCQDQDVLAPRGILQTDTDLESTDDELGLHEKQERFLVKALGKMTALTEFKWSCNHSPISIDNVWPTLVKCQSLRDVDICDNLVFSGFADTEEYEAKRAGRKQVVLPAMTTMSLRSTSHAYGSTKAPNLIRISGLLNHCPNLKTLDVTYTPPRSATNTSPVRPPADEFLLYGRWTHLTTLTLTNLRCSPTTGLDSTATFLAAHHNLEVLHLDLGINASVLSSSQGTPRLILPPDTLPLLRELHAPKDLITSILSCPSTHPRPLETLKGFKLSGRREVDYAFLENLKLRGKGVRRIELGGWGEMDDVRRLAECAPGLTWLDIGKKSGTGNKNESGKANTAVTNTVEWATVLSDLPDLVTFHGVRFFFEVSGAAALPGVLATSTHISMTDRSRIRKNDEVAAVLAWKCPKLRRVDYWEEGAGRIVVLVRDLVERVGEKEKTGVKWEVRRVKL